MSNTIIPLLNAQQQGMSTTITNIATRQEVFAQVAQYVAAEVVAEENKKLDKAADDPEASLVNRDGGGKTNLRKIFSSAMKRKKMSKQALPIIIL